MTPHQLLEITCRVMGLEVRDVLRGQRIQRHTWARWIAAALCREYAQHIGWIDIGRALGRVHGGLIYGVQKIVDSQLDGVVSGEVEGTLGWWYGQARGEVEAMLGKDAANV